MCGLVGVAGDIHLKDEKVFKLLLQLDTIRGEHSTGVAFINTANDVNVVKKAVLPNELFHMRAFTDAMKENFMCLIGHNRQATKGSVNHRNAHPFEFPTVVGAHNGTLTAQHRLPNSAQFKVDSENIFHGIDLDGEDETIPKLQGAYALTWWDVEERQLKIVRNADRPLFYCHNKDQTVVYWASEHWMLSSILTREKIEHTKVKGMAEDSLYTFSVGAFTDSIVKEKRLLPTRKALKGYEIPIVQYSGRATTYNHQGGQGHGNFGRNGVKGYSAINNKPTRISLMNKKLEFNVKGAGYSPPNSYAQWDRGARWYIEGWDVFGNDVRGFVDSEDDILYQLATRAKHMDKIMTMSMLPTKDTMNRFEGRIQGNTIMVKKDKNVQQMLAKRAIQKLIKKLDVIADDKKREAAEAKKEMEEAKAQAEEKRFTTRLIKDHRDNWISKVDFDRRYKACAGCDGNLEFEDDFKHLHSQTEGFCGECMTSPKEDIGIDRKALL